AAEEYLMECCEPANQKDFSRHVADVTGASQKRVRDLIILNSGRKGAAEEKWKKFSCSKGDRNTFLYELPQVGVQPAHGTLSPEDIDVCVDPPDAMAD
ncbi:MAG: hypothetical protein JZU65_22315, partial [Chlorobium sp.]|nr:hypothetical protein [Chlorobium sp.]